MKMRGRQRSSRSGSLACLGIVAGIALTCGAGTALAAPGTATFTKPGEHRVVVPPGVTSLRVVAVGARGGAGYAGNQPPALGGFGAKVTADLAVQPGTSLYALVGGDGETNQYGSTAGGGGGATDIRTAPASAGLTPDPRVLIAGGGGGGGHGASAGRGGDGGQPGLAGGIGRSGGGAAGVPAGTGAGGSAGGGTYPGVPGVNGGLGSGGWGGYTMPNSWHSSGGFNGGGKGGGNHTNNQWYHQLRFGGGGGGGGLHGGGGGGGESIEGDSRTGTLGGGWSGAGGGGGSSLVPSGGVQETVTSGTSSVTLSFDDTTTPVLSTNPVPAWLRDSPTIYGTSGTTLGDATVTIDVYKGSAVDPAHLWRTFELPDEKSLAAVLDLEDTAVRDPVTGAYELELPFFMYLFTDTWTVRARQVDGAGHVGYAAPRTFTIDVEDPTVSLTSPVAGTVLADATPEFSGVAGKLNGDLAAVRVKVRNAANEVVRTIDGSRDAATGQYTVTASPALPDGSYNAFAEQDDAAGNGGSSESTAFTVDATAPAPTLAAPAAARSNDPTQTLTGVGTKATRDAGTVNVRIYSGESASGPPAATLPATLDGSGNYQADTPPLSDGTWTAQTSQSDSVDNVGLSVPRTFTVDTTAPEVTLASAASAAPPALATFAGVAGTGVGDDERVIVTVHRGSESSGDLVTTIDATRDAATGAYTGSAASPLELGTYTAVAKQGDDLGNVRTSAPVTFVVAAAPQAPPGAGTATATETGTKSGAGTGTQTPTSPGTVTGSGTPATAPRPGTASDAEIRTALASVLAPSGPSAGLTAIVQRGYVFAFSPPAGGRLSITWFVKGKRKPVLIASGRGTFTAAGRSTVKIKLNRAGRKALKRAKRLRVTSKATYTIAGRPKITATRTFTLR